MGVWGHLEMHFCSVFCIAEHQSLPHYHGLAHVENLAICFTIIHHSNTIQEYRSIDPSLQLVRIWPGEKRSSSSPRRSRFLCKLPKELLLARWCSPGKTMARPASKRHRKKSTRKTSSNHCRRWCSVQTPQLFGMHESSAARSDCQSGFSDSSLPTAANSNTHSLAVESLCLLHRRSGPFRLP